MLPGSCPGVGLGVLGESKTLAWGFAMAPHRLRALVSFVVVVDVVVVVVVEQNRTDLF